MKSLVPILITSTIIIIYLIIFFKKKNDTAKLELKQAQTDLALTVIVLKDKIKKSEDSLAKNILATAELGGNIVGCFYGYCGGGSATIGQITSRIK